MYEWKVAQFFVKVPKKFKLQSTIFQYRPKSKQIFELLSYLKCVEVSFESSSIWPHSSFMIDARSCVRILLPSRLEKCQNIELWSAVGTQVLAYSVFQLFVVFISSVPFKIVPIYLGALYNNKVLNVLKAEPQFYLSLCHNFPIQLDLLW